MVTNDTYLSVYKQLHKYNINYIIVPTLQYTEEAKQYWQNKSTTIFNTASKLNLFNQTDLDKLVYLDADSFFLTSPDELFNYPDGAMYDGQDDMYGFSGLFTCIPANHPYEYYYHIMQNFPCVDGDLLGKLWFPFITNPDYRIPFEWFINIVGLNDQVDFSTIKGIHFCNKFKPWKYTNTQQYLKDVHEQFPQDNQKNQEQVVEKYITQYVIPLNQALDNE